MIEVKSNAVLRDGQQIAVIEDGVCRSYSAFPPVVKGQIKKAAGNAELAFYVIMQQDKSEPDAFEQATKSVQPVELPTTFIPHESDNVLKREHLPDATASATPRTIADLHALAEKGTIPRPPATHEALGSRTPAFVQWVKAYLSPEDFEAAYRGRKLPTIEEVEHEFGKLSRNLRQQEEASKDQNGGIRF